MVVEAAAAWHRRRAEIERIVAAAREVQRAQEFKRERAAAAVQTAWRRAAARMGCVRPYTRRVAEIDTVKDVKGQYHGWAAFANETPAFCACCREGDPGWQVWALRAVASDYYAHAEVGCVSGPPEPQRHEVAEESWAVEETMAAEETLILAVAATTLEEAHAAGATVDEEAFGGVRRWKQSRR